MRRTLWIFALLPCLSLARPVAAQELNETGGGLWIGAGMGAGWARVSCPICARDRHLGPSGHLRVGTRLSPTVLFGGEALGWTHTTERDVRQIVGAANAVAYLHPRAHPALYLKGGLGWVTYRAGDNIASNGIGMQVGAGYEFHITGGISLNNHLHLVTSSFASLKNASTTIADDVNVTLLQFGVGLTRR